MKRLTANGGGQYEEEFLLSGLPAFYPLSSGVERFAENHHHSGSNGGSGWSPPSSGTDNYTETVRIRAVSLPFNWSFGVLRVKTSRNFEHMIELIDGICSMLSSSEVIIFWVDDVFGDGVILFGAPGPDSYWQRMIGKSYGATTIVSCDLVPDSVVRSMGFRVWRLGYDETPVECHKAFDRAALVNKWP